MTQSDKKEKDKEMRKAESVPEKGKQLSRKAADKLKFYGVAAVLSLLCAGFIWFIFKPDTTETVEGTFRFHARLSILHSASHDNRVWSYCR